MIFIVPLANNRKVLVGGFPKTVHRDLVIFLDVLHLRATIANKVIVQRIPRALRQGASLRRGNTLTTMLMVVFVSSTSSAD